ncbi:MAG: fibronectin type III domain-containing protein [Bacteroidales bacterium]|nr:fibronectin type III domain-containing protein [Bacteroidales bacterium]
MKRVFVLFLAFCFLFSLNVNAQTQDSTIAIPNPSFENWSNGSGYSVTVVIFPLQVYSSYTYPTGWNYPTYPVNESITYSGMTVNVNTNLPLLKVANQTSGAVDGSHALKMQSFMLSDIISSTVYGLASSSLDPMLTTTVFPTVLSTGAVDIDNLLPLLSTLTANLGNLSQVLSTFVNVDINTLIDGGVSLNGVQPGKLTGYYKYTSATSGDNGGVLILGTKYNTTTHRREAVGGGYTVALTDTANYAPFEVLYTPLSEVNSSYPYVEADSLIIMMLSSANATPQQGSALFLDNLQLWAQQTVTPDTCAAVANLSLQSVDTMHATLSWTCTETPDHFEVEYGVQGFAQGSGTTQNVNGTTVVLSSLQPDTYYDVYVRSVCSSTLAGAWAMLTFHTDTLVPPVIIVPDTCASVANLTVQSVDTMHATLAWTCTETPDHFEVEYGVQGFAQGSGITQNVNGTTIALSSLQPDTYYDVYVRSVCSSTLASAWAMLTFHTDTLVPPVIPEPDTCSAVFNLHLIEVDTMSATIGWSFEGSPDHFEAEYGPQGFAQGNGTTVGVTESFLHLSDLQPDTYYDIYVRCVCDNDLFGAWAMMSFHTDTLVPPVIDDTVGIHNYANYDIKIYPNPAHGQCMLHFGQEKPVMLRLYAINGELLQEIVPQKETVELRLPESGVFLLYCELKSGVVVRKIVNQ